jgi:hypothetical protein
MDHQSVNIHNTSMSCGVNELSRINDDIEKVLYQIASSLYHPARGNPCAFFVWSDLSTFEGSTNAERLCVTVNDRNFGDVDDSPHAENPKTGNFILIYVWKIDHGRFKAWYKKERLKRFKKVGA